jgi:hypothetical protein
VAPQGAVASTFCKVPALPFCNALATNLKDANSQDAEIHSAILENIQHPLKVKI